MTLTAKEAAELMDLVVAATTAAHERGMAETSTIGTEPLRIAARSADRAASDAVLVWIMEHKS